MLAQAIDKVAQAAAEHAAGRGPAEKAPEIAQNAARTPFAAAFAGPAALPLFVEPFTDLLPVLIAGDGQQTQECKH
jgi:hypothetical protein